MFSSQTDVCLQVSEITVAPSVDSATPTVTDKLHWQRITQHPLRMKACMDYDEARHGIIRFAILGMEFYRTTRVICVYAP